MPRADPSVSRSAGSRGGPEQVRVGDPRFGIAEGIRRDGHCPSPIKRAVLARAGDFGAGSLRAAVRDLLLEWYIASIGE